MYRSARKKVAESISKLDFPEHYDWSKWLREPEFEEYYIDTFSTRVLDSDEYNVWPTLPSTRGFTFDLPKIKLSKAFKQLHIQKQKTNKIFFSFPKASAREIKEILSPADINFSFSVLDSGKGAIFRLREGKNKLSSEIAAEVFVRDFYLKAPGIFQLPLLLPEEKVFSIDVSFDKEIKVLDLLSNMKAEVINVELLNSENIIERLDSSKNEEIKFQPLSNPSQVKKVEVIQLEKILRSIKDNKKLIEEISFTQLSSANAPEVKDIKLPVAVKNKLKIISVKNFKIASGKVKQALKIDDKILSEINGFSFSSKQDEIVDQKQDGLSRDLEVILQPEINFGKEEKERIYSFLYNYQMPAADFLSENNLVLLNDELGTGKTLEIIGALNILFRKKDISTAIIVSNQEEIGWIKRSHALSENYLSGWYDHIKQFSSGLSASIIFDNSDEEWKNPSAIKIMSYQVFEEAMKNQLVPLNDLNRRGCLVIDEVEEFPEMKFDILPKYLWFLSGIPLEELNNKITGIAGGTADQLVSFGRTKEELSDVLPSKMKQDYWIEMNSDQRLEYEKALESGREKIYDLVQAGNPFLVQSNVFTLVHQLTQIGNFYGRKELSPKSELLLHHVKTIQKSGKKVLVYSQYDRQGTQRLEKLFQKRGIKYVLYQTGNSLKEMEDAIKNFAADKSVTVFLAGMKAVNAKMNLANVPYLIHFDQWWSPVTTWQAEERINSNGNEIVNKNLSVYNYFIKNSVEEKIQLKLIEKGLNNKILFDLLSSDGMYSLLSNEDWLEILELVEPKDEASIKTMKDSHIQYLVSLTTDDFAHKIKGLFGKIGYKNVSFKTAVNPEEVRLYGTATKNTVEVKAAVQCLNIKIVHKKIVREFVDSLVSTTHKIFVFTTGEFDESVKSIDDERLVLINKHQVANYLYMFNLI